MSTRKRGRRDSDEGATRRQGKATPHQPHPKLGLLDRACLDVGIPVTLNVCAQVNLPPRLQRRSSSGRSGCIGIERLGLWSDEYG